MLLEDAGILAERWRLIFPVVDLTDSHLQVILRLQRGRRPSATAIPSMPLIVVTAFMRFLP
jgi:hypothetical protein